MLVTGDLLVPRLPFMGDGFIAEWDDTLERLKALDFRLDPPGHGNPFRDKERISYLQEYMRDLQAQAEALHAEGLTYEEAAARIDMSSHGERYPQIAGTGVPAVTVQRIFELLRKRRLTLVRWPAPAFGRPRRLRRSGARATFGAADR